MLTRTFSLSLLFASLVACGPTVASSPCAALYDAYATWASACSGAELSSAQRAGLVAHCEARAALPGIEVAATAFQGCATQVAASSCAALPLGCLTSLGAYASSPSSVWLGDDDFGDYELFPRVKGTLATGTACDLGDQCQSGACVGQGACGVCMDVKQIGEACGATSQCNGGSCEGGVCVASGTLEGSACEAPKGASDCQSTLYCPDGTCVPRLHVGEACDEGSPQQACPVGSVCQASACTTVAFVHAGAACDDVIARCADEGTFCGVGVCRAPMAGVAKGGTCGFDVCADGLVCSYGVCTSGVAAGASCQAGLACAVNLLCLSSESGGARCAQPRANGDWCGGEGECGAGLFCDLSATPAQRCRPRASEGQACGDGIPCTMELTCDAAGKCAALDVCSAP